MDQTKKLKTYSHIKPNHPRASGLPGPYFQKALETLRCLSLEEQKKLIAKIQQQDPALARQLQQFGEGFALVLRLRPADLRFLWWDIERSVWVRALKGATHEVLQHVFRHLSKKIQEEVLNEIKKVPASDVDQISMAQLKILERIQEDIQSGKLKLA